MLPAYGRERQDGRDRDEDIEVELGGQLAKKGCAVYTSFGSHCDINLLTESIDNHTTDDATNDDERDDSDGNVTKDDERDDSIAAISTDNTVDRLEEARRTLESRRRENSEREYAILMNETIKRMQQRIKNNGGIIVGPPVSPPMSPIGRQYANLLNSRSPRMLGAEEDCDDEVSGNTESNDARQLASMMRDRVQAISSVRGLIDLVDPTSFRGLLKTVDPFVAPVRAYENEQGKCSEFVHLIYLKVISVSHVNRNSTDIAVAVQLMNNGSTLRHDVEILRHSNKELIRTVKSLLAKNSNLLSSKSRVEAHNSGNMLRISQLEEDVAAKTIKIDDLMVEIQDKISSSEKYREEKEVHIEQKRHFEAANAELKKTIQDLESKNAHRANAIENLKSSLDEANKLNESFQVRVNDLNSTNAELKKVNNSYEVRFVELVNAIELLTNARDDVKLRHEKEVKELKWMIEMEQEEKAAASRKSAETFTNYKAKMTKQIAAMSTDYAKQVSQLSTTIDNLVEDKNVTSLRMDAIQEELAVKKLAIDEMAAEINSKNMSLDEKSVKIVELMEQIKTFKAEDEVLKVAVEALVASNKEHVQQKTVLEDDLVVKKATIVSLSSDLKNLNATCDEMAFEKASIFEQLELSKVRTDKLEKACEDHESINADYASALERLASLMQEVKERNEALTDRIEEVNLTNNKLRKNKNANDEKLIETMDELERVTKELNGERVGHEKEIQEIKRIFETFVYMSEETLGDVTAQMTSQMSAQNVNMAYLAKCVEEAKLDIRQKDMLLQEKNAEIQRYIDDLEAQRNSSQCGIGSSFSDFWSSSE